MNVAIVDDEQYERNLLNEYCEKYAGEYGVKIITELFPCSDVLLEDYKMGCDIIIFDIDMPGTNGMDAAKKIREIDKNVAILFVTNVAQYAIDGYSVEAVDYVIKPIGYYEFTMKFQKAINKAVQKKPHTIVLDTLDGILSITTSEIWYVEVMSHYLLFHTKTKVYKVRGSLKEQTEVLIPYHFFRVHKSYLINLEYVVEIQTKAVIVGTDEIPLGRMFKDQLLQEYMHYLRG